MHDHAYGPSRRLVQRYVPLAIAVLAAHSHEVAGQSGNGVMFTPTYQSWQFTDAVPLDAIHVKSATQISAPFLLERTIGTRWRASANGAVFSSRITTDATTATDPLELTGLTDLRLRLTGRVISDVLQLTLGVNVPTGVSGLSQSQYDVLRVTAAPALGAQVAVPGAGFGGTVGAIVAHAAGPWALAMGASVEQRGTYAPLEAVIAGQDVRTELNPGRALHVSFGADRPLGEHRLIIGVGADLYASDELRAITASAAQSDIYQLGPTGTASMTLQIHNAHVRDFTLQFTDRYRSTFTDNGGATVEGSSGNYLEVSGTGTLGSVGRTSLVLGVDMRQHTGLPVDDAFIGAGLSAVGGTIGLSLPVGSMEWRPSVRYSMGTLTTQRVTTAFTSITAGLTIARR